MSGDAGPRPDTGLPRMDATVGSDAQTGADASVDAGLGPDAGTAFDASSPRDSGPRWDGGAPLPTGTPASNEIRVNETLGYQTLDGVGADSYAYPYANDLGWNWDAVRFVFDELDLAYVRLASWFVWWETENDNADPMSIDWSGFQTTYRIIDSHETPFIEYLSDRNIETALAVFDVGDWLAGGSPRRVFSGMYSELGESIAAYILFMQMNGYAIPYTEVQNEPGIEASINYASAEDLRDAALAILDQLDRNGLGNVMLHGPNYHAPGETAAWASVWLANQRLRDRTVALSYHTWWSNDFAEYDAIRQVAEANGKPVWATEVGYCALSSGCFNGTHYLLPETWETAWDYAMSYYRAIAWSRASRVYHWSVIGFDGAVSPTGMRYPSFYVLKQFANFIPPGAVYLDSATGDPEVLSLAFLRPDGQRTVILLNTGGSQKNVVISSVAGANLSAAEARTTSEGSYEVASGASGPNASGQVEVTLPPESVTSLRLSAQ